VIAPVVHSRLLEVSRVIESEVVVGYADLTSILGMENLGFGALVVTLIAVALCRLVLCLVAGIAFRVIWKDSSADRRFRFSAYICNMASRAIPVGPLRMSVMRKFHSELIQFLREFFG